MFVPSVPPASRTEPSFSKVAVWCSRALAMLPGVAVNVFVIGSYNSAELRAELVPPESSSPPERSTLPPFNSKAEWKMRGAVIAPDTAVKIEEEGL